MRHLAISAANFSTATLVLPKQHRFKHKGRFSQVYKHKNQIKTIYTQILSYDTFEIQKKVPAITRRMQEISLID